MPSAGEGNVVTKDLHERGLPKSRISKKRPPGQRLEGGNHKKESSTGARLLIEREESFIAWIRALFTGGIGWRVSSWKKGVLRSFFLGMIKT